MSPWSRCFRIEGVAREETSIAVRLGLEVAALPRVVVAGTKPADLPIEVPTTIETIVNLKTADPIGLQVPQAVLVRADQVLR